MDLHTQIIKYQSLNNWFQSAQGRQIAHAFTDELQRYAAYMQGESLLQIGLCGENVWEEILRFKQRWVVTPYASPQAAFVSSLMQLPLDRHSVDCVLAPLMFEAFSHHHNPLDEIDRILKPMGYIIFYGINPWSLWGLSLRFGQHACFGKSGGNLATALYLKHIMTERGYQQCMLSNFYYIPPVTNASLLRYLAFLNVMGKMIWPLPPGFFCMIFQKHQGCITPWSHNTAKEPFLLRGSF